MVVLLLLLGAACSSSGSNKNQPLSLVASATATSVASPVVTPFSPPAAHWTATSVPSPQIAGQAGIVDVVFINPSHGWLARGTNGQGELLVTDDGGTSWKKQYTSEFAPQLIQFVDANNGWLAGCAVPVGLSSDCETQLLATRDGGNTWTPATSAPVIQGKVVAIGFVSQQDGWVLGAPGQLLRTQDGGTRWESVPVLDGVTTPVSLQRLDEHIGWVLTKDAVLATRDGGATWTTAANPCNAMQPIVVLPGQMSFSDEHVGWIGCDIPIGAGTTAGALYRTGDGGATWHLVGLTPELSTALPAGAGTVPAGIEGLDFLNEQDGWFACGCAYSGLWRTHNGGHDWDLVDVGLEDVNHVLFVDDAHGWAWGFGPPLRTADGGADWQKVELPP
jgi:photosystem II stability/assembly factor-like uncharacterized protein